MKTHQKSDPKMKQNPSKNTSKIDAKKGTKKENLKPRSAEEAVSPNPIISKDILRSEVRRKQTKKADCERWVQSEVQKVECKGKVKRGKCRQVQKGKCRQGTHNELKHARWPATTCGFNRLRAFRLAKVLRQSFVGLWVAGLWAWACVYVCVCVCVCVRVCVCVFWPRGSKRGHKPSQIDQLLKLFRPILGHGGTNEDHKINRTCKK